jgi:hypothetical protein
MRSYSAIQQQYSISWSTLVSISLDCGQKKFTHDSRKLVRRGLCGGAASIGLRV